MNALELIDGLEDANADIGNWPVKLTIQIGQHHYHVEVDGVDWIVSDDKKEGEIYIEGYAASIEAARVA